MRESERRQFDGKVALVTGAAQGLGAATARAFAARGAAVCLVDRDETGAQISAGLQSSGARATFFRADVSALDETEAMVAATVEEFGRLDFAYNNAGILQDDRVPLAETPMDQWDRTIAVNLTGVFLSMRAEIPAMQSGGGGVIVNASSMAGRFGGASIGIAAYGASKAGVLALTRAAARDYAADGIRAVSICPGPIETDMVRRAVDAAPEWGAAMVDSRPMKRLGTVEEIASTVVWLCSPDAGYITGEAIAIDGAAYC